VNSPHAEDAVRLWQSRRGGLELGWHPCLTLDRPVAAKQAVSTLVAADGRFYRLGEFIRNFALGRVRASEIEIELRAQHALCTRLLGHPPTVVNFHHHLQAFPAIGAVLRSILGQQQPRPYVRRIREPWAATLR